MEVVTYAASLSARFRDPHQSMCAQPDTGVEQRIQGAVDSADGPGERRCQSDPVNSQRPFREQLADPRNGHAAYVRVARIVDSKVVPQYSAPRAHPTPHRARQPILKPVVEQRGKHSGLIHNVLARRRKDRCCDDTGVALQYPCGTRQDEPGPLYAFRQQLDAVQVLRSETHAEEVNEVHPGAAPDLEQSEPRQILPTDLYKEIGYGTLALLCSPQYRRVEQAVPSGISLTTGRTSLGRRWPRPAYERYFRRQCA